MDKIGQILMGVLIAFIFTAIGGALFTYFTMHQNLFVKYELLLFSEVGGKIISLGSLLNIPVVYWLLSKRFYNITRGVIAGIILLVIISQLV